MICEICTNKLELYKKLNLFNLFKCHNCNHVISNIKVSKNYYHKTYSDDYVREKHKNYMNNPNYSLFKIIYSYIESKKNSKLDLTGVDIIAKTEKKIIK